MTMDMIQHGGDPQVGNLATPINSSELVKKYINNLPAYREGLEVRKRGLEIGMAHGYFIYGPFALLGPFRDTNIGSVVGVVAAAGLIVVLFIALYSYGVATNQKPLANFTTPNPPVEFSRQEGWSEFAKGFLIGGCGGALVAFVIYQILLFISSLFF